MICSIPQIAKGLSAVYGCGISWSRSLIFCVISYLVISTLHKVFFFVELQIYICFPSQSLVLVM